MPPRNTSASSDVWVRCQERLRLNQTNDTDALEAALWAAAEERASESDLALIDADLAVSSRVLDGLFADSQDRLEAVHGLTGPERDQVIADFAAELDGLRRVYDRLHGYEDDFDDEDR